MHRLQVQQGIPWADLFYVSRLFTVVMQREAEFIQKTGPAQVEKDYMEENNGKQPSRRVQKNWIRDLRKEAVEEIEQYIVPNIEPTVNSDVESFDEFRKSRGSR